MARLGQLIGRALVSAFARRIAYVVIAFLLASVGLGRAHAATGQCTASDATCDQGQAMSACQSFDPTSENSGIVSVSRRSCVVLAENSSKGYYILSYWGRQADGSEVGAFRSGNWYYSKGCATRADYNGAFPSVYGTPRNGSVQCFSSCQAAWYANGDGTFNMKYTSLPGACDALDSDDKCKALLGSGYYYNGALGVCEPKEPDKCPTGQEKDAKGNCVDAKCPEGMTLNQDGTCRASENECPAGQIKSPAGSCLPGDGQCAKGEALGKDGTCKRDADGDGKPDEGEDDGTTDDPTFGGGDSCDAPPSCSGDVIMCGQARIQWRIDCNTRKNRNISGGSCASMPVCTGEKCDALEYSGLLMQWRTACAMEKLLAKGTGDGDSGEQPNWTKVGGMSQDPGNGSKTSDTEVLTTKKISTDDLDQSGFGGGSCPGFASASGSGAISQGYGQTFASPPAFWCEYVGRLKASLIVVAACVSVFILTRGGA